MNRPETQLSHFRCCTEWYRNPKHTNSRCSTCQKVVNLSDITTVSACGMYRCQNCFSSWATSSYECTLQTVDVCGRCGTQTKPMCIGNAAQRQDFIRQAPPHDETRVCTAQKLFQCTVCKMIMYSKWVLPTCHVCVRKCGMTVVVADATSPVTDAGVLLKLAYCNDCGCWTLGPKSSPIGCLSCGHATMRKALLDPLQFERLRTEQK